MKKIKCFFTRHEFVRVGVVDKYKVHYECERCGNNYIRDFFNEDTFRVKTNEIPLYKELAETYQEKFKPK